MRDRSCTHDAAHAHSLVWKLLEWYGIHINHPSHMSVFSRVMFADAKNCFVQDHGRWIASLTCSTSSVFCVSVCSHVACFLLSDSLSDIRKIVSLSCICTFARGMLSALLLVQHNPYAHDALHTLMLRSAFFMNTHMHNQSHAPRRPKPRGASSGAR